MTDDERTHLAHAATRCIDDLLAHRSLERDIIAMVIRVLPVALDMHDASTGDLDLLRGLLGRLVADTPTITVEEQKDAPI